MIAFYLPQFHPIPENDEWWGPGFTEWRNVVKARPLFAGHYQPHLPGELGYYDLRVPEVRKAQADLASAHGIGGFCYYHYWFHGRRLLERPFEEVLRLGEPDFPFMLCWANEPWTRNWDAQTGHILVEQRYSEQDDLDHIRYLIDAFNDPRYIKIDGRPVMAIYRVNQLPRPKRLAELWRREVRKAGFPDVYLCSVESHGDKTPPESYGFDANVGFFPRDGERILEHGAGYREHTVMDFASVIEAELTAPEPSFKRFPVVMSGWDNTARRRVGATIFSGSSPDVYEEWLRRTVERMREVRSEENLVFAMAWNEWAEGNHLEPDEHYGRGYLMATARALGVEPPGGPVPMSAIASEFEKVLVPLRDSSSGAIPPDSPRGHLVSLLQENVDPTLLVLYVGPNGDEFRDALSSSGIRCSVMEPDVRGPLGPAEQILEYFRHLDSTAGAIVLADVLDLLVEPVRFLDHVAGWLRAHGSPPAFISVRNSTHFDQALRLLCGEVVLPKSTIEGYPVVRPFDRESLKSLFEIVDLHVIAENNFASLRSEMFAPGVEDAIPSSVLGALKVLSDNYNPEGAILDFIWQLGVGEGLAARVRVPGNVGLLHSARLVPENPDPKKSPSERLLDYMASVGVFSVGFEDRRMRYEAQREVYVRHLEEQIKEARAEDAKKGAYIAQLGRRATLVETTLTDQTVLLGAERDAAIASRDEAIASRDEALGAGAMLAHRVEELSNLIGAMASRRSYRLISQVADYLPRVRRRAK